jgi:hypothetical protein
MTLFCKSYAGDLHRIERLITSVEAFNADNIPFYISVPSKDLSLFRNKWGASQVNWLTDEEVLAHHPQGDGDRYKQWDGRLSQQVIKAEYWRLGISENCVCLDSDAEFIQNFRLNSFLDEASNTPYTVICQSKEYLQLAENRKIIKVLQHFKEESAAGKAIFERTGPDYDFCTPPVIWSSKVWQDLTELYLEPNGITIWDAIAKMPLELRWYGEALLKFRSIELLPIEPLFRVYLYDWQYANMRKLGETPETLRGLYIGIVKQSNWEFEMDTPQQANRKSPLAKLARRARRSLAQFR